MSLDTVLEIGKALRNSKEGLHLFKYFKSCPKDDDEIKIIRLSLPVTEDGTFDLDRLDTIPENKVDELLYLDYRTSDQDSSPKKYLFGDIFYSRTTVIDRSNRLKKPSEYGNFTFERGKPQNAFLNGEKVFTEIKKDFVETRVERLLSEIMDEKDRSSFIRDFLKGYLNDQTIKLSKKLVSYENKVEPIKNKLKSILNNIQLFKFHDGFRQNRSEVDKILLYAPAFYKILEKGESNISGLLSDKSKLEDVYVEAVLESDGNYVKKLFKENETTENLSKETRNNILSYTNFKVFLHFDFLEENKHWFQFEKSTKLLKEKLNSELVDSTAFGLVPKKSIYRTLCSGDDKNDIQFPNFVKKERYKSFSFKEEEFEDFLYTSKFLDNPSYRVSGTSIAVYVFPKGENLSGDDYLEFLENSDESRIAVRNSSDQNQDSIFVPNIDEATNNSITSFDFVFSDYSGNTVNDLVELSGIKRSTLKEIVKRVNSIQQDLKRKYARNYDIRIEQSFKHILGSGQTNNSGKVIYKPNKKYQNHLLKVLPKIYSRNYYQDETLLSAFIEKVEFTVRNGDKNDNPWYFKDLKFHLEFLLQIQNHSNNRYMEITNSKSYQVGLLLGNLAKGLRSKINSFEKNYVGNLTRRISTIEDCIEFKNRIEQKNILHGISYRNYDNSNELATLINSIGELEYDKERVAFGFFESYYGKRKDFKDELEKLLSDYAASEEDAELVEKISNTLQNYQTQ